MPGPYDYTVNIPQPPAQNFLQSLSGIMQIRNMQDQAEIARQQSEFAKQMHPLEMARVKAGITASDASAAESVARKGLIGTQSEAAKFELEQKQKFQADMNELASDPLKWTPDEFMKLGIKYPQSDWIKLAQVRQSLPTKAVMFGDNLGQQLVLSTQIGDTKTGQDLLDEALKAAEGDPELKSIVPKLKQLKDQYTKFPEQTSTIALMGLNMFAPDRAKSMFAAMDERLKSEETQAKIEKTRAETKKALGESATGEVEIKDVFTKKLLKDSIDKADQYSRKADTALEILNKIDSGEVQPPSGFVGNIVQYFRDKYPIIANDVTALRKDFIRINNSEAIKDLPKGSASDKDVAFAREGLTSSKTNLEQFRKAVEAMARLNSLDSAYNEAQAAWISRNGNIGDAKREISVLGDTVSKGTGFREWWKKSGSSLASGQTPAPTKTDQITGTPAIVPAYAPPAGVTIKSVR